MQPAALIGLGTPRNLPLTFVPHHQWRITICFQMFELQLREVVKILNTPPPLTLTFEGGGVPPKSQLSPKRLDFLLKLYS